MSKFTFTHVFTAEGFKPSPLTVTVDTADPETVGLDVDDSLVFAFVSEFWPEQVGPWFKTIAQELRHHLTPSQTAWLETRGSKL